MNKTFLRIKSLSVCLIFILFTNSIGHAKEISVPENQQKCGEWKIENPSSNKDQRIGIVLFRQAAGNDCYGMFTLKNQTNTILGGGYSFSLRDFSTNAKTEYLFHGNPILIPGIDVDIKTIPYDKNKEASILLQGQITLESYFAVDLSFFVFKTALELIPLPTGCLISYEQMVLISLRTAPIMERAAKLALEGKFIESKDELSRVLTDFYERVGEASQDIGIECLTDYLKSKNPILEMALTKAKIILSFVTWVPVVIFDYLKYKGSAVSLYLSYSPSVKPTPTPVSKPIPTSTQASMIITFRGPAGYQNSTTICTCESCDGTTFLATININSDGSITGTLSGNKGPYFQINGTINSISGNHESGPNNCNAYCTDTVTAKIIDSNRLEGTITTTCTPGNCQFDNCVGTYTFSLPKK
jgi:hypothetical protein